VVLVGSGSGSVVVVGWAVWRRTGAVRTTLLGLTAVHSSAGRRALPPLPFLQALSTLAHDLARRRSLAQLPFLQALVGRRSLAHSRVFQDLAVECAWSLPVRRGLAAVGLAWPASAGAAMRPATSRAPKTPASGDARRTGRLMLRSPIAGSRGSARPGTIAVTHRTRAARRPAGSTLREEAPKINLWRF
jgi:hypothetical protein